MLDFKGRVAIVTGAGHGIGEATAKLLAELGASVVCNAKSTSCKRVVKEINAKGGKAIPFVADITDPKADKAMIEMAVKTYGRLDILINNAGGTLNVTRTNIEDVKEEDWNRIVNLNLTGHFHCIRFAVPYMKKQRYGRIVNIGSGAGIGWSPLGIHAYTVSKAGLMGFTRQCARELAPFNICVNCISPAFTNTHPERLIKPENMTSEQKAEEEKLLDSIAVHRRGEPIEVARAIAFFASEEASYICGQTLSVCGGRWIIK